MKLAIAGKGGTGKTTISGTLARILGRSGRAVLAVDADSNPNLDAIIGLDPETAGRMTGVPRSLMKRVEEDDGESRLVLTRPLDEVLEEYSVVGPDDVRMVVMGRVDHAGSGCMCGAHATVRGLVGELMTYRAGNGDREDVVLDMEAGLEHLGRGTGRHVDGMLAVVEPYFRSLETGKRVVDLADELGVSRSWAVANKVRDESDRKAVMDFCDRHGLEVVAEIPYDRSLVDAERAGRAPVDFDPEGPAVEAIEQLAARVVDGSGT